MSERLLLGIDEGTTAVKAALFDCELRVVAQARRPVALSHPRQGWVEQDPEEILEAVVQAVAEVLEQTGGREVMAAGIDHQGESVMAWDARGARALTRVIVWQDKRQQALLEGLDASVVERSGLPLDPYFSAGKMAWLARNDEGVMQACERGTLRMGTVESFLLERLARRFATDLSTASRTQLLALGGRDWDERLLQCFGVRREWLARIGPTFGRLGELRHESWPVSIPLRAQLVDQQAALAGSGAVKVGEVKATYGTGVFVLGRTDVPHAPPGLLPTVAWAGPVRDGGGESGHTRDADVGEPAYALDGGVFTAGSLLDWLAQGLGLARDTPSLLTIAAGVRDASGVTVLPALAGLGAPWWRADAHGVLAGLHGGVTPAHVARAALESIAMRVADIVEAMGEVDCVHADGGLSNDATLLEIQADALGVPLRVGAADATVAGAALLAGVGAGAFSDVQDAVAHLPGARTVNPTLDERERVRRRRRWREFVQRSAELG